MLPRPGAGTDLNPDAAVASPEGICNYGAVKLALLESSPASFRSICLRCFTLDLCMPESVKYMIA